MQQVHIFQRAISLYHLEYGNSQHASSCDAILDIALIVQWPLSLSATHDTCEHEFEHFQNNFSSDNIKPSRRFFLVWLSIICYDYVVPLAGL